MNEPILDTLLSYGSKIQVEKGVYLNIKHSRQAPGFFYLLEEGICALTSITDKGEEAVYLYFYPRRIIGFNQLLAGADRENSQEFFIITKTPCTLYRFSNDTFQNLLKRSPAFNEFLMKTLADNYYEVLVHFHRRMEESAVTGLCRLLLSVARPIDGQLVVPKFFTYAELAKYLGTHAVTVSRIMAKMKQMGYMAKDRRGIVLKSPESIRNFLGGGQEFNY